MEGFIGKSNFFFRFCAACLVLQVVTGEGLDEMRNGGLGMESPQKLQVLLDTSVIQHKDIESFIMQPGILNHLINFEVNFPSQDCSKLSKVLKVDSPSVYITMSMSSGDAILSMNCENLKNLKTVIQVKPEILDSQFEISQNPNYGIENIVQVQTCETGYLDVLTAECKNFVRRNLQQTYQQLQNTYQTHLTNGKTVPEAVVLMANSSISSEFFAYLTDELEFYSFGNATVSGQVTVVANYESVYEAIVDLMSTALSQSLDIDYTVWKQAFNITTVSLEVSDPTNYHNSAIDFVGPAAYYLKYLQGNDTIYPEAVSLTFSSLTSFFSSVFSQGAVTENSSKTFSFNLDPESLTTKLDSIFSSSLDCSCNFCTTNFSLLSISVNYSSLGYAGDIFGSYYYKQGSANSSNINYYSTPELITESDCFNFIVNLNTLGTSDTYTCKSSDYYQNCTDLIYLASTNTLELNYTTFGLFAPIQICPSGTGYNSSYYCEDCQSNCECEKSSECDSCLGHFDYINGLCQNCSEGFTEGIDGPCTQCAEGFDNDPNSTSNCSICITGFADSNESRCSICAEGWEDDSEGNLCFQCTFNFKDAQDGTPCGTCADGYKSSGGQYQCDTCSDLYGRSDNGTCESCKDNCYCDSAGNCSSCITGYIYYNQGDDDNNTGTCYEGFRYVQTKHIVSKYFDSGMGYIELVLNVNIEGNGANNTCEFYFSNYELLGDAQCTVKEFRTLLIVLGEDFELTTGDSLELSSNFLIVGEDLSMLPIAVQIDYSQSPSVTAVITGNDQLTTSCTKNTFVYSASSSFGQLKQRFTYLWTLNETQGVSFVNSDDVSETIEILIDSGFSGWFNLTLTINSTLATDETYLAVEVTSTQKLSFKLDTGSGSVYKKSNSISIMNIETDLCSCKSGLKHLWEISPSASISETKSKLLIPKNTLDYGDYSITLTLTCGSLTGSSSINIKIVSSDLVIILSKSDQSISQYYDLSVDGSKSYDPDDTLLAYSWTIGSEVYSTSSSVKVLKSYLQSVTSFTLTLTISAIGSRSASKSLNFVVVNDNPLKVSIFGPGTKVPISDQIIIVGVASQGAATGSMQYEWEQISGPSSEFNSLGSIMWIPSGNLEGGNAYSFQLKVTLGAYWLTAFSSFSVNQPPTCKSISTSSNSGTRNTLFNIYLKGCYDLDNEDTPLTFKLYIKKSGLYLALLNSISATFIGLRFPSGTTAIKFYVCDTLNDCWVSEKALSVSRNLRQLQESEKDQFLELVNEFDPIYAVAYMLLENVKDKETVELMWNAFVENCQDLTVSDMLGFVFEFIDNWQQNGIIDEFIDNCVEFVIQQLEKREGLNEENVNELKKLTEIVLGIKQDDEGKVMGIRLLSYVLNSYEIAGIEHYEKVAGIQLYETENYFSLLQSVEILKLRLEPQEVFPEDSLVRIEIAVSKSSQNSIMLYFSMSSSEYVRDGEIYKYDPALLLEDTSNEVRLKSEFNGYNFECMKYLEGWQAVRCSSYSENIIELSSNGLYNVKYSKKSSENKENIGPAVYLTLSLILITAVLVPFLKNVDTNLSQEKVNEIVMNTGQKSSRNSRMNTEYEYEEINVSLISKHLFFSLFIPNPHFVRVKKFIIFIALILSQISIQVILLNFEQFPYYIVGILSPVLTMPIGLVLIYLLKNTENKVKNLIGILLFTVCISLSLLGSIMFTCSPDWPKAYLISLGIEILIIEPSIMLIRRNWSF